MRRMRDDQGAVAVLVAILAVALFGFGALVIDVGALYSERRQLQNGADAAALAVAQSCAGGACGPAVADANAYADVNARDKSSRVPAGGVCGSGPGLTACTNPPTGLAGNGYVRVTTRTEEVGGGTLLPPLLARVIDPAYNGTDVAADATVVWGRPGGIDAQLAITFSVCEYDKLTEVGGKKVFAKAPYDPALERTVYFHDTTEASKCPAGPSGADLPGGFGWLDESGCKATIVDGWVADAPGASASQDCKAALTSLHGKTVFIPIYSQTNGLTGSNGEYLITNYAAFVLTGWNFPGTRQKSSYRANQGNSNPCNNSQTCLSGFFIEAVAPGGGPVGSGSGLGLSVVQLVR